MSPTHHTSQQPRIRPDQTWRCPNLDTGDVLLISPSEIQHGTVQGFYSHEGLDTTGVGAWSPADFDTAVLVNDPEWPTFRLAVAAEIGDPAIQWLARSVGAPVGSRSMSSGADGGPESCWDVIAPTEDEAFALVQAAIGDAINIRLAPNWDQAGI